MKTLPRFDYLDASSFQHNRLVESYTLVGNTLTMTAAAERYRAGGPMSVHFEMGGHRSAYQ